MAIKSSDEEDKVSLSFRADRNYQMSPRAFQTIIVASMGSKDRLELESKVLAAALKQSHARGDSSGVSLAHKQIFLLLRYQQSAQKTESGDQTANRPVEPERPAVAETSTETTAEASEPAADSQTGKKRKRVMPNIVWTSDDDDSDSMDGQSDELPAVEGAQSGAVAAQSSNEAAVEPGVSGEISQHVSEDEGLIDFSGGDGERAILEDDKSAAGDSDKPTFNAYGILNVDQIASFEEIHRSFLFLVRRILFSLKKAKRKSRKPLLDELQNLWIAHDILSDPVTRTDFDFRVLGLRGAPDVLIHSAPEDKSDSINSRTPLRIGELMQCAGLLEPTELEIAADMHKAMPEMLFGAFLVKQGFISEEDLGQVLTGQRLLKNGNMTVGHYQMCMKSWRENHVPIEETAVAEGLVTQQEMDRVIASGQRDTLTGVAAYQSGAPSSRATAPQINQEEAAKRVFSAGHAVPLWKDQLDWSEPEAIQAYVEEESDYENRKPVESSLDIEGITDAVTSKDGKKSLRRLMEGIHSTPEPVLIEESGVHKSLVNIFNQSDTSQHEALQMPGATPGAVEESVAADAVAAEQELKDAQAAGSISRHGAFSEEMAQPAPVAQNSLVLESAVEVFSERSGDGLETAYGADADSGGVVDTRTGDAAPAPAQTSPERQSRPTAEVPLPKITMEERNRPGPQDEPVDDGNVFGEVDYDDEDDAIDDMDLSYEIEETVPVSQTQSRQSNIEQYGMTPSSVTETAAIDTPVVEYSNIDDLLDFSTSTDAEPPSEIRKVLDEAFHGVRTSETAPIEVPPSQEATQGLSAEMAFEALAEEAAEIESGVYPSLPYQSDEETTSESLASSAADANYEVQSHSGGASANSEEVDSQVASEAISQTEAVSGGTGVLSTSGTVSMEMPPVAAEGAEPTYGDDGGSSVETASQVALEINIEESNPATYQSANVEPAGVLTGDHAVVDPTTLLTGDHIVVELHAHEPGGDRSSFDAGSGDPPSTEVSNNSTEPVSDGSFVRPSFEVIEHEVVHPVTDQGEKAEDSDDQDDTVYGIEGDSANKVGIGRQSAQLSSEVTQNPPVQSVPDSDPAASPAAQPSEGVKLTDVSGSIPGISPLEESKNDRLKSGEWQIVYKLEGSIADHFLSDDAEEEMPKLRPRLTEIDSIIPSSISKLAKGDTADSADGDDSQDDKSSDPVIKPLSNNYYRNDKSKSSDKGGKSGDKGDKSDKGSKGKKD